MDQLSELRLMHFSSAQRKLRGGVISKLVKLFIFPIVKFQQYLFQNQSRIGQTPKICCHHKLLVYA